MPVDAEGLVTDALPDDARLVYVTPAHQFPLGVAMSCAGAWRCSPGRSAPTPRSSKTTTTASTARGRPLEPLHSLDHRVA